LLLAACCLRLLLAAAHGCRMPAAARWVVVGLGGTASLSASWTHIGATRAG
jgi:hypothetical protein